MAFFDLMEGPGVIVAGVERLNEEHATMAGPPLEEAAGKNRFGHLRGHRYVTAIENSSPAVERVGIQRHVVASAETTSVREARNKAL